MATGHWIVSAGRLTCAAVALLGQLAFGASRADAFAAPEFAFNLQFFLNEISQCMTQDRECDSQIAVADAGGSLADCVSPLLVTKDISSCFNGFFKLPYIKEVEYIQKEFGERERVIVMWYRFYNNRHGYTLKIIYKMDKRGALVAVESFPET